MASRGMVGWKPSGAKPRPNSPPTSRTSAKCRCTSWLVSCTVSSNPPDSSNCPPGSKETEAPPCAAPPLSPIGRPWSRIGSQPNRRRPSSIARIPPGSYGGGSRSVVRKPNFSCSVPIRQASRGLPPAARYSASCRRSVIGVVSASPGLDIASPVLRLGANGLGLQRRQPNDSGRFGPQDSGAERSGDNKRLSPQGVNFFPGKPAVRPDQQAHPCACPRNDRRSDSTLESGEQRAFGGPGFQQRRERAWRMQSGHGQALTLFRGL